MSVDRLAPVLDRHVAPFDDQPGDWEDVLSRAGTPKQRGFRVGMRARVVAVAIVVAVVGGLVATPAGRSLAAATLDRFSTWVQGEPGDPASGEQQAAFERRNQSSYASFPTDTKLRLVLEAEAAGETFQLFGFRTDAAFCLRLVRRSAPGARGSTECVPTSYLEAVENRVVVAGSADFRVGDPAQTVDGIYGFAADDVQAVEVERELGSRSESVPESNVFLSLRGRATGTAGDPPPLDSVAKVWGLLEDGGRTLVPFVATGYGTYGRERPSGPAYFGPPSSDPRDLPGPKQVEASLDGAGIDWLERREERGEPLEKRPRWIEEMGTLLFARTVQPDPGDPFRVGLTVVHAERGGRFRRQKDETVLCLHEFQPLGSHEVGGSCFNVDDGQGPIHVGGISPTEFTRVSGVALDGVDSLTVFLASGRRLGVSLRDNVFSFQAPFAEFPGKIVAYDARRRVVGLHPLPGPRRLRPCPRASFVRKVSELPPPQPYEQIDLGARTVNGQQILGRTAADVMTSLGQPARIRYPSDTDRSSITELRYGSSGADFSLLVQFGMRGGRRVATFVVIQGPSTVDARLGHILRIQPARLEQRIRARLAAIYDPDVKYGSIPARPCTGSFRARGIRRQLTFGLSPYRPSRPFVFLGWQ